MTRDPMSLATERLRSFIERQMSADGTPGLSIVVTDRQRTRWSLQAGVADVASGAPVGPEHLFQIGSIGKSLTAITILRLVDKGRIDLHQPVTRYLPWFAVASRYGPITIGHLLSHTAGIIGGTLGYPDARAEVHALRHTSTATVPGTWYHYSNVGYHALGLVVAAVCGRPFRHVVTDTVLRPLGMDASTASIDPDVRPRLAVGHVPLADDRPWRPGMPLAAATWVTTDTADGSICVTAEDFAAYMRMLLRGGVGPRGQVVSAEAFERFTTPVIATNETTGAAYGYGIAVETGPQGVILSHGGGMIGQYASMVCDLGSGIGVGVTINGPGSPRVVGRHALTVVLAALAGDDLPDEPAIEDPMIVPNGADYAGRYRGAQGSFEVRADGAALHLVDDGRAIRLRRASRDAFHVIDDAWAMALLEFGRTDERVVDALHGERHFRAAGQGPAGDRDQAGDRDPASSSGERSLRGLYRSSNPWETALRVAYRRGALDLVWPDSGSSERLTPCPDEGLWTYRLATDPPPPERFRFADPIDGRPTCLWAQGLPYYRSFQEPSPWTSTAE